MKLGFIQDNPPAWSPTAPVEGTAQIHAEYGRGLGVGPRGSWARVQVPVQHLGNDMLGRAQDVLVGRRFSVAMPRSSGTHRPSRAR
jgi:hypothetical protein